MAMSMSQVVHSGRCVNQKATTAASEDEVALGEEDGHAAEEHRQHPHHRHVVQGHTERHHVDRDG